MQVGLNPNYGIKYYRQGFYKLIRYNRSYMPHLPPERSSEPSEASEGKFAQAYSRARSVVLQLGLCNDWQYFITCTVDPEKFDRYDLAGFYKAFSQWLRDQSKKYGSKIEYFFVPELHKDGAIHLHGMIRGLPDDVLCFFIRGLHPLDLVENGFLNWPAYQKKFGFCSLGKIKDPVKAVFYICKYISKDLASSVSGFGVHTYRASIGLNRAQSFGYVYGRFAALDVRLEDRGDYCDTAWVQGVDDFYWLQFIDEIPILWNDVEEWGKPFVSVQHQQSLFFTNIPLDQIFLFDIVGEG